MISSAARDRIKLAIDQLEEGFHRYDERSSQDANESYEAALQRGKALGYQEAAHLVKSACTTSKSRAFRCRDTSR